MYFTEHFVVLTERVRLQLCSNEGNTSFSVIMMLWHANTTDCGLTSGNGICGYCEWHSKLNLQIRFVTDDFICPIVMHCHILLHEDIGMMMVVNIVPQGSLLRIIASTVKAN